MMSFCYLIIKINYILIVILEIECFHNKLLTGWLFVTSQAIFISKKDKYAHKSTSQNKHYKRRKIKCIIIWNLHIWTLFYKYFVRRSGYNRQKCKNMETRPLLHELSFLCTFLSYRKIHYISYSINILSVCLSVRLQKTHM